MSELLFGVFKCDSFDRKKFDKYNGLNDIYYNFEEDDEIIIMIKENVIEKDIISFAVTSKLQMYNSADVLFPYDKYSQEELFPESINDMSDYLCIWKKNINLFYETLIKFIEVIKPTMLKIFICEGLSEKDDFGLMECTIEEFFEDLFRQVKKNNYIDTMIYNIVL